MMNENASKMTFEERTLQLVANMTTEEKISQLCVAPKPIDHLNLPKYNYINEASHGVFLLRRGEDVRTKKVPIVVK